MRTLLVLVLTAAAFGQVKLELVLPNKTFRQGELIPIELQFTAPAAKRIPLTTASYDRSGRMSYETFTVTPKDSTHDPLAAYFHSLRGFIGGGTSGISLLSETPEVIRLDLNEWVSIDQPGTYRLSIHSGRAGGAQSNEAGWRPGNLSTRARHAALARGVGADAGEDSGHHRSAVVRWRGSPRSLSGNRGGSAKSRPGCHGFNLKG